MRLARFTLTVPAGASVLINPAQVVAVTPYNNFTHISVSVHNQNGQPFFYTVSESLQAVGHELNLSMAD